MSARVLGRSARRMIEWNGAAAPSCSADHRAEAQAWRRKAQQIEQLVKLGSFEVDFASSRLTWSAGTYTIFGLAPGTPVTIEQALGFYDGAARADIIRCLDVARRTGDAYDLTVPFHAADGRSGWVRMIGQVEAGPDGDARLIGVVRDISRERDSEERLRVQAHQDVLTGLPNRRAFQTHIEAALGQGQAPLALCIVDVDRFKAVNDQHGHDVGDQLLQETARRLSAAVRTTDIVARLGGDEFAVVLHGMRDGADAHQRAGLIVEAMREPFAVGSAALTPSVSVGIALSAGSTASPAAEAILKRADIALYQAKLDGRDRFRLFKPHLRKRIDDHERLIADVTLALARGQFEVHYQPIVDLRSRVVRGWEALVRWHHPERGLLGPGAFMAALTDAKTSVLIDDFVLGTSLRQMRQWLDADVPVTCAGVNVSDAQLRRPDLIPTIMALLDRHRLTPDRLKIEVLETAFLGRATSEVAATIETLARLGVVSALDDFGTGYASLIHLKQFKVERIKIDRSFVANLGTSGYDQAIVKCMIGLGRDLGIRITAEGIETRDQLDMLCRLGCDCGQGYLFGRPMHPDDVPGFLRRWHDEAAIDLFGPPA